jgi:acyl-homoserine-lactone acylase
MQARTTGDGRLYTRAARVVALCATAALASLVVNVSGPEAHAIGQPAGAGGYGAQIRRTGYGIPHILAHDYRGLGYGYGYAFAQDNLCVMADTVVTRRGERSRYFGPAATSTDALVRGTTNLASDTYYRWLGLAGTVPGLLARPAPLGPTTQVRQLVDGYVAGYNRYLRDTGVANLPDPTCRGAAWVGPITALDIWNTVYSFNGQTGAAALKQAIATATPPAATAPDPAVPALPVPDVGVGSNGWVLGRNATRAGDGMVLADPHLPWTGDARLYQV